METETIQPSKLEMFTLWPLRRDVLTLALGWLVPRVPEGLSVCSLGWSMQRLSFLSLGLPSLSLFLFPLTLAALSIVIRGMRWLAGRISVPQCSFHLSCGPLIVLREHPLGALGTPLGASQPWDPFSVQDGSPSDLLRKRLWDLCTQSSCLIALFGFKPASKPPFT